MPRLVVCPSSPLLPSSPSTGDVPEVEPTRAAARAAVRLLVDDAPRRVVVVADESGPHDETARGTLAPWGPDVVAGGHGDPVLGLGHTVGAWLLDDAGWTGPRLYTADLRGRRRDDAVLVLADGTAKRTERAPGHLDERAEAFDGALADALAAGDADALGALDLDLADELWARGAPTLTAVADAVRGRVGSATLHAHEAALGVGWFVAAWTLTDGAGSDVP